MKRDWRWQGDKELRLHGPDGAVQAICRKTIRGGTVWWLNDAAGQPVQDKIGMQVYRLDKRGIQAAAEQFADGKEVLA